MREKKVREQFIAVITLCSVFVFFIYLKMNPEINSTSLSSKEVEINDVIEKNTAQLEIDNNTIKDDKSVTNVEEVQSTESIIEYTESELKRAKSYLNRTWKPDHTINLAAWKYVSRSSVLQDTEGDLDVEKNQVVNAVK